jgi:hypothetical protein
LLFGSNIFFKKKKGKKKYIILIKIIKIGLIEESKEFLEKYKNQHVLYHKEEMKIIEGVQSIELMYENEFTSFILKNKFELKLSQASYELLLKYLQVNYKKK